MFTEQLPNGVFAAQREFIRAMDANRDFVWWAKTLIREEVLELQQEFERDEIIMPNLLKELADVIYVVAGFYNTMPMAAPELLSTEQNQEIQDIIERAAAVVSTVSNQLKIPLPLIVAAFEIVHASNMSKLDDEGKPIRREDGKILKGPNYKAPDMEPLAEELRKFHARERAQEVLAANKTKEVEDAIEVGH